MPSKTTGSTWPPETAPDALVGVDRSGVIRFVNRQTECLFGYQREDLVGAPLESMVPNSRWEVRAAHHQGYDGSARTRHAGTDQGLSGRRRDGTDFPVNITFSPMDTGHGLLVIAAVRDMTQHQTEQEVRRLLERLSTAVEHSGEAIISTSLDNIVTGWNPAAEKLFGYPSEEVIGQSDEILSPADRTGESEAIMSRITDGEQVEGYETIRVRRDGTEFDVSLSAAPIREVGGAVVGASALAHDMTSLREASDLARRMIESSLDSLVAISPEGKITDVNEATTKVTGVPREKLIGTSFSQYFTEPEKAERIYQLVFTEGMAVDYPLTLRRRNGHDSPTEVLYNASVYRDHSGNVIGVFAAARDVTKQMQAQRMVKEQQSRELDRLAELERFQRLTVGRELKMIELKKQIEFLNKRGPGPGRREE